MPYKPNLLTTLKSDYEDAARKYTEARDIDAKLAERYLCRMKLLGKNIDYTQKMIDADAGRHVHTNIPASVPRP